MNKKYNCKKSVTLSAQKSNQHSFFYKEGGAFCVSYGKWKERHKKSVTLIALFHRKKTINATREGRNERVKAF